MTVAVSAPTDSKPAGRIRQKNQHAILAAAAEEFARHGFKGTSMSTIAQRVGLPKANLHYYFGNKLGLYVAVMRNILDLWDSAFSHLSADDEPGPALAAYIRAKMEFSRREPQASKIFAMEVISGGECLSEHFNQDYQAWFRGRAAVFQAWIDQGKTLVGYEISFTRHFYRPAPMRTLDEIKSDIYALEHETEGLLDDILIGGKQ